MKPHEVVTSEYQRGRLSFQLWGAADLRDIRVLGRRALDGIYFTLRDTSWNGVPINLAETPETVEDGESLTLTWRGTATLGQANLQLSVSALVGVDQLELHSAITSNVDVELNRAGFCAISPLEAIGQTVVLTHQDGSRRRSSFPMAISSFQLWKNVTSLSARIDPATRFELDFGDDVFETEDHRNWADSGFKTYSPPLDRVPLRLEAGVTRESTMRMSVLAGPTVPMGTASRIDDAVVELGAERIGRLPELGMAFSPDSSGPVSGIHPAFLSVEVMATDVGRARLHSAFAAAAEWHIPLDVTLAIDEAASEGWLSLLADLAGSIRRLWVVDPSTGTSTSELVGAIAGGLAARGAGRLAAVTGGGTRGYFAELGRARSQIVRGAAARFSVAAEVHNVDDARIADAVRSLPYLARDARRIAGRGFVAVGPTSLAERLDAHRMTGEGYGPFDPAHARDPRESAPIGSIWALGLIAGLASLDAVSLLSTASIRSGGQLSPFGQLLAHVGDSRGAGLVELRIAEPRRVVALAVAAENGPRVYLGNLTAEPVRCEVIGDLNVYLTLPAYTAGVVQWDRTELFE